MDFRRRETPYAIPQNWIKSLYKAPKRINPRFTAYPVNGIFPRGYACTGDDCTSWVAFQVLPRSLRSVGLTCKLLNEADFVSAFLTNPGCCEMCTVSAHSQDLRLKHFEQLVDTTALFQKINSIYLAPKSQVRQLPALLLFDGTV